MHAAMHTQAAALNEFDGPCSLAAGLLETESVQQWVARSFPLILVDEAQDLDEHRMRILQGLSASCRIVAAADAFQCLTDGRDTAGVMDWLESAGQTHRLTQPRRTTQRGLLAAARAVSEGRDVKAVLTRANRPATRHGTARVSGFSTRTRATPGFSHGRLPMKLPSDTGRWRSSPRMQETR